MGSSGPVDVRTPPGVEDGGSSRIRGKGEPGQLGAPTGDLVITLRVEPDPQLRRDGLDLHVDLPITVVEAVRRAKLEVPTLEGRVVLIVPP
ncbi:MAG: DnaJ-class molecular chaperone [Myxococcota bacterium]